MVTACCVVMVTACRVVMVTACRVVMVTACYVVMVLVGNNVQLLDCQVNPLLLLVTGRTAGLRESFSDPDRQGWCRHTPRDTQQHWSSTLQAGES